jgi:hypothetical protein
MKAMFFGVLFFLAAGLVVAMLVGVALRLVVFFALAAVVAAAVIYVAGRIYGPPRELPGEDSKFDHV